MWPAWSRNDGKWELVNVQDGFIVNKSGMTSKCLSVIVSMVDYMEYGQRGNLPKYICSDLDYIASQGGRYCPCHIKIPFV